MIYRGGYLISFEPTPPAVAGAVYYKKECRLNNLIYTKYTLVDDLAFKRALEPGDIVEEQKPEEYNETFEGSSATGVGVDVFMVLTRGSETTAGKVSVKLKAKLTHRLKTTGLQPKEAYCEPNYYFIYAYGTGISSRLILKESIVTVNLLFPIVLDLDTSIYSSESRHEMKEGTVLLIPSELWRMCDIPAEQFLPPEVLKCEELN